VFSFWGERNDGDDDRDHHQHHHHHDDDAEGGGGGGDDNGDDDDAIAMWSFVRYRQQMEDMLRDSNPGLARRFQASAGRSWRILDTSTDMALPDLCLASLRVSRSLKPY
jgi:hypothetical protein